MRFSGRIATTIGTVAIFAVFVVPAMASTITHGSILADNVPDKGKSTACMLLLARGGNGNGGGGKGSGGGGGDRDGSGSGDRDRDRDGNCLESVTSITYSSDLILAGNGKGSEDRDQDHDHDHDTSCQV